MVKKKLKTSIYLVLFLLGILILIYLLFKYYSRDIHYLLFYDKIILIGLSIFIIIFFILFIFEKRKIYEKNGFYSKKIYFLEILFIMFLMVSISSLGGFIYGYYRYHNPVTSELAIGIYTSYSNEPLNFSSNNINNPVLRYKDVNDVEAYFVADPFLIYDNESFFLFFEVTNKNHGKGEIGLATSSDGFNWNYEQIILSEDFHLSYPCVFKWENDYYMIPESGEKKSIRLYKAINFPYNWRFIKTLLSGETYSDNTIFNYDNIWWLYTQTRMYDNLKLYYADIPQGPWFEHPKSPIIEGDANIARPGGRVIVFDNRIIRYAQDCDPYYGNQVWAIEINELSKVDYSEHLIGNEPVLKGFDNWNTRGMHHISPIRLANNSWIASVDGY